MKILLRFAAAPVSQNQANEASVARLYDSDLIYRQDIKTTWALKSQALRTRKPARR